MDLYQTIMMITEEKEPDGKYDEGLKTHHSPERIAKKYGVSVQYIQSQLKAGIKVEGEHTKDKDIARTIALQHLDEDPKYYTKLDKIETEEKPMKENFDGLLDYLNEAIGIKSGINTTGVEAAVNNMAQPHKQAPGENKTGHAGAFNPEEGGHTPEEIAKKHGATVEEVNRQIVIGVRAEVAKGVVDKSKARKIVTDRLYNNLDAYSSARSTEHNAVEKTPAGAPPGAAKKMHESVLDRYIGMVRERKQPLKESTVYDQFVYITEAQLKDIITPDTNGRAYTVIFKFNGKPMIQNLFWPDARRPSREDMTKYLHLLYPGAILTTFQRFEGGDPYGHGVLLVNKASIKPELRK